MTSLNDPQATLPDRLAPAIETMAKRRSHPKLEAPAPTTEELRALVAAANTAPDHGRLVPWRFIELRPSAYQAFGELLADALSIRSRSAGTEPDQQQLDKERTKLHRAPLVVVAAATYRPSTKIPRIEQYAAAAAATHNLILAATSSGWGTMWRTGPAAYDENVKRSLSLNVDDDIVGFIYIGTPVNERGPRETPAVEDVLETWQAKPLTG